jgi:hypothetical protein
VAAEVPWAVQVKRRGDSVRAEGPQAVRWCTGGVGTSVGSLRHHGASVQHGSAYDRSARSRFASDR